MDLQVAMSHLVYSFGVAFICFVVNFIFMWPENHFLSLIVLASSISLIIAYELHSTFKCKKVICFFSVLAIFCVCLAIYRIVGPVLPTESENHGWLLPAQEQTPPNGCDRYPPPAGALLFIAGTNGVWTKSTGKSVVLSVGDNNELSFEKQGNKITFDADIHDKDGNLVARIIHNEFHLISGEYSYRERSDDRSKLTVYDRIGKEILYINYANPTTVLVRGVFFDKNGNTFVANDDRLLEVERNIVISGNCKAGFSGSNAGFKLYNGGLAF
jgi:hypothetical protein